MRREGVRREGVSVGRVWSGWVRRGSVGGSVEGCEGGVMV